MKKFAKYLSLLLAMLMAFSLMIIAPTVIIYLFTQKYIIQGVSKTGLKG